jgi:hypothetical protein
MTFQSPKLLAALKILNLDGFVFRSRDTLFQSGVTATAMTLRCDSEEFSFMIGTKFQDAS